MSTTRTGTRAVVPFAARGPRRWARAPVGQSGRGVTLIETLFVVLVFMIVLALSASALVPLFARSGLDESVWDLGGVLRNARAIAIAEGSIVHVRIVRPGNDRPQWIGVYCFGEERPADDDSVRGFVQDGVVGLEDWPEWKSYAPEEIPWDDGAICREKYRGELNAAVRFCVHGDGPCPGADADAYNATTEERWLPRTEESGGPGEYRTFYFFPDGSASANFLIVLRTRDGRAAAVRVRRIGGRVEAVSGFSPGE